MKPKKLKVSITLDPVVLEQLHLHADEDNRSLSGLISIILSQWLDKNREQTLMIMERQRKL